MNVIVPAALLRAQAAAGIAEALVAGADELDDADALAADDVLEADELLPELLDPQPARTPASTRRAASSLTAVARGDLVARVARPRARAVLITLFSP
jgi:hypothetical protein